MGAAVRHFLIARKYDEADANKLAVLREELRSADAQSDTGQCTEYDTNSLSSLFKDTRKEALRRMGRVPTDD